jgi:glyoxylate reductase
MVRPNQPGTNMPTVFVGRPIPESGLALLRPTCELRVWPGPLPPTPTELQEAVQGSAGVLSLVTDRIDGNAMDAAGPGLCVISNFAVGVDNVDVTEATRRGIPVGNTPGVLTETTADLAWALLMAAARRIVEGDRYVREGQWRTWEPQAFLGQDIAGATLGILGYGRIGQAVARRAAGFGMRILVTNRSPVPDLASATQVDFDTLLAESDFISIHTPLTTETRGLFDQDAFSRMKAGAILVNTARGPIVDSAALAEALATGPIGAAGLDVTDPEPIPTDSPLLQLPNCLIVPHVGSASIQTRNRMATMAAENLLAGLRGQLLPNCINRDQLAAAPRRVW